MSDRHLNEKMLGGDPYNPNEETTRGSARVANSRAAHQLPTGDALMHMGYSFDKEFGSATQDENPKAVTASVDSKITNRGGAIWKAQIKSKHESFFYKQTAIRLESSLFDIVEKVHQFCDREFTVDLRRENPEKGTFSLAVFVDTALVMIRLKLWSESEMNDIMATSEYVMECELREGDPISFGAVFRTLRGSFSDISSQEEENQNGDMLEELDLSIDALVLNGSEIPSPQPEDWSTILAGCEEKKLNASQNIEVLSSIAQTYDPENLSFLCKTITDKKIGFLNGSVSDVDRSSFNYSAIDSSNARYQQLWAIAVLLNHLVTHPPNAKDVKDLLPTIHESMHSICNEVNEDERLWYTVLDLLSRTFLNIIATCRKHDFCIDNLNTMMDSPIKIPQDVNSKYSSGMVGENKVSSKSITAQQNLNEAYKLLTVR